MRQAVNLVKFQGKIILAKPLADMMLQAIPEVLSMEGYDLIVPVPLHKSVKRKRGYNQVELIGRRLGEATGILMDAKALVKIKNTPRQSEAAFRFLNLRDSFDVPEPSKIQGKRVLLIDDIFISGATVSEASKALARAKPRFVDVFTLARRVELYSINVLEKWMYDCFQLLPVKPQNELLRLKLQATKHSSPDGYDKHLESERWKEFSLRMRMERHRCEVCGAGADQVHHLHYRSVGREKPRDVMVLCDRCHSFVHPLSEMAIQFFEQARG